MQIKFGCPHCNNHIQADTELSGDFAVCPFCNLQFMVPAGHIEPGVILDDFRIEHLLGRGSMGEVFLATQLSLDRYVALKVLPPALTSDEEYVQRFLNEIRMMGRMNHPNLVTAFKAGSDGGYYFLAMWYVEGDSLEKRVTREGLLSSKETLRIAFYVSEALAHAWNNFKVLHRDIKPSNIMIEENGQVRLMDMGLSKSVVDDPGMTQSSMTIGTPHYMSPEQALGDRELDFRSDMYSLGSTLYHLLTGEPPYSGGNATNVLTRLVSGDFTPLREKNPKIPETCEAVIHRMMQKDPEDRYQSWEELKRDVKRALKGWQPLSEVRKAQKQRRGSTNPAQWRPAYKVALSVAAVILTGFFGIAVGLWLGEDGTSEDVVNTKMTEGSLQQKDGKTTAAANNTDKEAAFSKAIKNNEKRIQERLANLQNYWKAHDTQYEEALNRFKNFKEDVEANEYKAKANERIQKIREKRKEHAQKILAELDSKVQQLEKQEKYDEAIRLLQSYDGDLSDFISEDLETLMAGVKNTAEKARKAKAAEKLQDLRNKVSDLLIQDNHAQAVNLVKNAPATLRNHHKKQLRFLRSQLQTLNSLENRLQSFFEKKVGSRITPALKIRDITMMLKKVDANGLYGIRQVSIEEGKTGRVWEEIPWRFLKFQTKLDAILGQDTPHSELLAGWTALRKSRPTLALTHLNRQDTKLAALLKAKVTDRFENPTPTSTVSNDSGNPIKESNFSEGKNNKKINNQKTTKNRSDKTSTNETSNYQDMADDVPDLLELPQQ